MKDIEHNETLHNTDWDDERCKIFYKMIHQFNGTAGSYGYPEISQIVAKLETYIVFRGEKANFCQGK